MGSPDAGLRARANNETRAIPQCAPAMNEPAIAHVPTRPASQWPIGMRLRFRPDAVLNPSNDHLRGKPLLVLSEMKLIGPAEGRYSWRQQILALSTGRIGWARPDQLDLPLDGIDPEAL